MRVCRPPKETNSGRFTTISSHSKYKRPTPFLETKTKDRDWTACAHQTCAKDSNCKWQHSCLHYKTQTLPVSAHQQAFWYHTQNTCINIKLSRAEIAHEAIELLLTLKQQQGKNLSKRSLLLLFWHIWSFYMLFISRLRFFFFFIAISKEPNQIWNRSLSDTDKSPESP